MSTVDNPTKTPRSSRVGRLEDRLSWHARLMKPGERIPMIQASVDALLDRFDDADLILREFHIETDGWGWNSSNESRRNFLTGTIPTADDESLVSLHDFLIGSEQAPVASDAEDIWGPLPIRVFLSHKWEDAAWVGSVKDVLAHYGITAFVAHQDIAPSKLWREAIKSGLRSCHVLVAVMHDEFHASQWCDQEVGWALGRGIPVATVRRADVERGNDGFLEEVQDITYDPAKSPGSTRVGQAIFRAAIRSVKDPELVRRAIAEAFVSTQSYENTRNLWPAVLRQDRWEKASLDRLKFAVETNSQVYGAVLGNDTFPDLITGLVDKYNPAPASSQSGETPF
jgi:hypothetical protein